MATEQIRNDIELAGLLRGWNDKDQETRQDRKPSWSSSTLVGAIVLARLVSDETLSREILKSVAALLKQQHYVPSNEEFTREVRRRGASL
jgi:hypothetical protein